MNFLSHIFKGKSKKSKIDRLHKEMEMIDKEEKKTFLQRFKFLRSLYFLLPSFYRNKIEEEARYAGYKREPAEETVLLILLQLLYLPIPFSYLYFVRGAAWYLSIIPSLNVLLSMVLTPYLAFSVAAESRRKRLERFLPDLLILTSANIKSGLTIDKALLFAARPEFGELSDIVRRASYEIYGGKEIGEALKDLSKQIKSEVFKKTISLLVEGLRAGGAVAKLLEETANDIRNTEILQKEIRSSVVMYVMFIFFAAVLGAPSLFGISVFLVTSTTNMWKGDISMEELSHQYATTTFISVSKPNIDLQAFELFAVVSIIITNLFAGMIISLIQTGKFKSSIKYSPTFISISLSVYYVVKKLLFKIFGSLLGV